MRENGRLERHPQRTGLAAPLRAFPYSWAGGATLAGWSGLNWGEGARRRRNGPRSVLSACICLCDEAHHLNNPHTGNSRIDDLISECGERLWHATDAVVVLFTATPVTDQARDARDILRLTQGSAGVTTGNDEGYVSWFMERPLTLFANTSPPPEELPELIRVNIDGTLLFRRYRQRRFAGGRPGGRCLTPSGGCNPNWATAESLAYWWHHEARHLSSGKTDLAFAKENCPKLAAIADSIHRDPRKTAILIHRENGLRTLVHLLDVALRVPTVALDPLIGYTGAALTAAKRENNRRLDRFNDRTDNVRGERVRVIVLPAEQFSEGVSLRNVRRLILADLSPRLERARWAMVKQRVGRALRMCSHVELPEAERTLSLQLYVAVHAEPGLPPTIDQEKFEALRTDRDDIERGMTFLRKRSVDAAHYATTPLPVVDSARNCIVM